MEHSIHPAMYLDPRASVAARVEDLVARMTLPEKVGQLLQLDARQDLVDIMRGMRSGVISWWATGISLQRIAWLLSASFACG
ncbi:hypothetical protein [Streptomyces sp. SAS_272]|uniref:hypothetical protein n=1 Tax=Streptomyces sp. SAS_272 TaxID=3412747 RepID=UPI00403CEED9